ncbi:MAG: MaoC family dehydratase [Cyanobacteria bacterium]|nr:MaoC family dehydratase [Cyanobacteriota bacterium]
MSKKTTKPEAPTGTLKASGKESGANALKAGGKGGVIPIKRSVMIQREVGESASHTTVITDQMVKIYAALVKDENPIHVDPETGKRSIFGANIAHGMLIGSLFGPVIVNQLIGPGCIYRKQVLEFDAPVPIGEEVTATVSVIEAKHKPDKDVYVLQTECFRSDGQRVINGEAIIIALPGGLNKE